MYNKYSFIAIISLFLFFGSAVGNAANINENENPIIKAKSIGENLINLNIPLHIVLAIDSSASMYYENQSAKSTALEFLKAIENKTKDRIKIGYVSWRNVPVSSSNNLSSNFTDINYKISNINFTGNTCFRTGINRSFELLRNAETTGIYNVLIIISDGEENCDTEANFTCDELKNMNPIGIYIYPIQLGESYKGRSLLKCLERPIDIPKPKNSTEYFLKEPVKTEIIGEGPIYEKPFQVQAQGNEIVGMEPNTNMTVSKSITDGALGPHITLKLAAPGIEAIKTGVVIAVDSSGSLGKGGNSEYGNSIRASIPEILDKIEKRMPKANISIVSWDDNVDFAYSPLSNNNASNASLVPISQARKEIAEKEVFLYKDSWCYYPFPLNYLVGFFSSISGPETYYYCKENESTDLGVGLESARKILNKTVGNRLDATRKLILFVTARSEFFNCSSGLISKTKNENCDIHTIGIGVSDGSMLQDELIKIAGDKTKLDGDRKKYHYSPGSWIFDKATASTAVDQALKEYYTENISNKISFVDTLYPYLHVDNRSIVVMINKNLLNKSLMTTNIHINSDNTTTLEIVFGNNFDIKPNDVIQVSFDTYLDLSLPIDATNLRTSKIYSIHQNTPTSFISYNWLGNDFMYKIPLPESNFVVD